MDEFGSLKQQRFEEQQAMPNQIRAGALLGGQRTISPEEITRHTAFNYAWQIHCGCTTDHEEILKTARAFEAYLKGGE